jgi:hypothetical protein
VHLVRLHFFQIDHHVSVLTVIHKTLKEVVYNCMADY